MYVCMYILGVSTFEFRWNEPMVNKAKNECSRFDSKIAKKAKRGAVKFKKGIVTTADDRSFQSLLTQ